MAWSDARSTLVAALETLGHEVHLTPPPVIDDDELHIVLAPPARTMERRASHIRRTTYDQRIVIIQFVGDEGQEVTDAIATAVDDLVELVNGVLDENLQLGGHAVSVAPPAWEEMTVAEIPEGSALLFAQMFGNVSIVVETVTTFSP